MIESNKPEIHLEVSNGNFRIPTENAVYIISVTPLEGSTVTRVVEKIVEKEKGESSSAAPSMPTPIQAQDADGDDFYKVVSADLYNDIGQLAKSLSSTIMELPAEDRRGKRAELDEAGEKIENAKKQLKDIVTLTEKATMEIMDQVEKVQGQSDGIKDLLSLLKDHSAFEGEGNEGAAVAEDEEAKDQADDKKHGQLIEKLLAGLSEAKGIVEGMQSGAEKESSTEKAPAAAEKKIRHLFPLDVVFQTLYELCTNETVKTHITKAREQADSVFALDVFHDLISEKISTLEADSDNFFTVPLSDIFHSLHASCSDDKIQNLFKRMEKNKESIFLDQSLPLEAPPTEEVEVEATPENPGPATDSTDPRHDKLSGLLEESIQFIQEMEVMPKAATPAAQNGESAMSPRDLEDITKKIEDAFLISSNICSDVSKITEALSFQDIAGQQILKIIKLLSDFQVQLLGIVVSFGSQLKHKEEDQSLSLEESKKLAQNDVDAYLQSMTVEEVGGEGSLDQDSVNNLLEEMGF